MMVVRGEGGLGRSDSIRPEGVQSGESRFARGALDGQQPGDRLRLCLNPPKPSGSHEAEAGSRAERKAKVYNDGAVYANLNFSMLDVSPGFIKRG